MAKKKEEYITIDPWYLKNSKGKKTHVYLTIEVYDEIVAELKAFDEEVKRDKEERKKKEKAKKEKARKKRIKKKKVIKKK